MSNNEIRLFNNHNFGQVRVVIINSETWFVGNDIAKALGYARPKDAIRQHCCGAVKHRVIDNLNREQETNLITKGDIYRLIVRSKLPEAEKFEKWVFDEVLPTIDKHGAYITPQKTEELLLNPDTIIQLATELKEEREKRLQLEATITQVQPALEQHNMFLSANNTQSLKETAKALRTGRSKLMAFLRHQNIFNKDNSPASYYIHREYFTVKFRTIYKNAEKINYAVTRVTPKGHEFLFKYLTRHVDEYVLFDRRYDKKLKNIDYNEYLNDFNSIKHKAKEYSKPNLSERSVG